MAAGADSRGSAVPVERTPLGAPRLSVVVPTHERPARVAVLLRALARQTLAPQDFELVLVDDGSREPLAAAQAPVFALTLLRQERGGPASARNLALSHCRAELCLILNDDTVPAEDLLERHLAAHAENRAAGRGKLAVLGTFRFSATACQSPFTQLLDRSDLLFEFSPLAHLQTYGWPFFWTCNISLPVAAIREAGGFDAERFPDAVGEDCELGWRLEQLGWRVQHRTDLCAEHEHVLDPAGYFERQRRLGRALARMHERHGDARMLRLAPSTRIDGTVTRQWQATFEALMPQQLKVQAVLERLEVEQRGQRLPDTLVTQLAGLVARTGSAPLCRGFLEQLRGHDPEPVRARGPRGGTLTSIIVPSFDALPMTRRCLEALRACRDERHKTELIFVDNGSSDGSREYLAAQPDVRLIANQANLGAPRARNQALALAQGDWVVFMDNDVLVTPHWLDRLLYHAQIDPDAACVGPLSDRAAHSQQIPCSAGDDPAELAAFAQALWQAAPRQHRCASLLSSFLVLVRRTVSEGLGGFDERFSPWGFEDDDFTLRAALLTGHNRVALDVFVRHLGYGGVKLARHEALLDENWRRFRAKWDLPEGARRGDYSALEQHVSRSWTAAELRCGASPEGTMIATLEAKACATS